MTMKTFRLTPAEFEAFCNAELGKYLPGTEEETNALVEAMSSEEFNKFSRAVRVGYQVVFDTLQELVDFLREGYDPFDREKYPGVDPLCLEPARSTLTSYRNVCNSLYYDGFANLPSVSKQYSDLRAKIAADAKRDLLNVTVDDRAFTAEAMCDVLWSGWECDATAWVVNDAGQKRLVHTNHGTAYFAEPSFLEERIAEYRAAIAESEVMLALLKQNVEG